MSLSKWGKCGLGVLAAAAFCAGLLLAKPAAAEDFTKAQVEQMIHDYIIAHPDVVLKAVDDFQKKDMEEHQQEALKLNHEELFNNEKSPYIGNPDGDVTMIEFFDYNCHYCKQIFPELKDLADHDKHLKIIFKDFPILGPTSETSAKWALAAQRQGKYFAFHQKMMEHKGPFSDDDIENVAKAIGLDLGKAKADIEGTEVLIQLERNRELASQMNFNGTPSFVINDEAFSGVPDKKELQEKIDAARKGGGKPAPAKDGAPAPVPVPANDAPKDGSGSDLLHSLKDGDKPDGK
jgi:protein-disulfide isomerase